MGVILFCEDFLIIYVYSGDIIEFCFGCWNGDFVFVVYLFIEFCFSNLVFFDIFFDVGVEIFVVGIFWFVIFV